VTCRSAGSYYMKLPKESDEEEYSSGVLKKKKNGVKKRKESMTQTLLGKRTKGPRCNEEGKGLQFKAGRKRGSPGSRNRNWSRGVGSSPPGEDHSNKTK